jgi:nucleoside phosphorylase
MARVDVLVVAALPEEYDAARAVGSAYAARDRTGWQKHDRDGSAPYESIEITSAAGPALSVALARPTRMGGRSIGPITTALTERLNPQCLAMCGVCAGNPILVALGDVVVAELVYEYDEGERTGTDFLGDHRQFLTDERWVRAAQEFSPVELPSYGQTTREEAACWFLERLLAGDEPRDHPARARYLPGGSWRTWPAGMQAEGLIVRSGQGWALTDHGRSFIERRLYDDVVGPDRLPFEVKVAPMASGNVVVKDAATWARLSQMGVRTVAALEMEAATVATVARQQQIPHWLVVKGVMDHANPRKDDRYRTFTARASAEVLYALLTRLLAPAPTRPATTRPVASLSAPEPATIRPGIHAGGARYLLHRDAVEETSVDGQWVRRGASADQVEPERARVWLRQVEGNRDSDAFAAARHALRTQARLLREQGGRHGMPRLLGLHEDPDRTTLVIDRPVGRTWRMAFGPAFVASSAPPPDRLTAAAGLAAAATVGEALARLHRSGHSHRMLSPDAIFLIDRSGQAILRDLGLAGMPAQPGEGTAYRAPEQWRMSPGAPAPGSPVDVYQLAALVHHTMTGHPPSPVAAPPVRANLPNLPTPLDTVLRRALDVDPVRRPVIGMLVTALRDGRRQLCQEGAP